MPSSVIDSGLASKSAWPCKGHDVRNTRQSLYFHIHKEANIQPTVFFQAPPRAALSTPIAAAEETISLYCGGTTALYAIGLGGAEKWQLPIKDISTPVLSGTCLLFVICRDGQVFALDDKHGWKPWNVKLEDEFFAAPLVSPNGIIYVAGRRHIFALYDNGGLKWQADLGEDNHWGHSTVALSPKNDVVYIGTRQGSLLAFSTFDSNLIQVRLRWSVNLTQSPILSSPAVGTDGTIHIGSRDGFLYAVDPTGKLLWKYAAGSYIESSPAIGADGTIYIGASNGVVHAVFPNGSHKWSKNLNSVLPEIKGTNVRGQFLSSPTLGADGTVYVTSHQGYIFALDPSGKIKWHAMVEGFMPTSSALGVDNPPIIGGDGGIYFSLGDTIYKL